MLNSNQKLLKLLFESWKLWTEDEEKEESSETLDSSEKTKEEFEKAIAAAVAFQETLASEPELEKNIKDSKKIILKDSKLMFDGKELHWLTQGKVFKSWPASSGHYQDLITDEESLEISLIIMKVLKNGHGKDLNDLKSEMSSEIASIRRTFHGREGHPQAFVHPSELIDLVDSFWEVDYIKKFRLEAKPLTKMKQKTDSKLFIAALGAVLDRLGLSNVSATNINAATRRERTGESDEGPIPEGRYVIQHNLQEAPMKGNPDAYISLLAAIKLYQGAYEIDWTPEQKVLAKELIPQTSLILHGRRSGQDFGAVNLALNILTGEDIPESASLLSTIPWGNYRVKISQIPQGAAYLAKEAQRVYKKRFGFYIHGGSIPGSGGCIDLGNYMEDFSQFWSLAGVTEVEKSSGAAGSRVISGVKIPLEVKYLDEEKIKLLKQNKIAQKYKQIVFTPEKSI
jgi:hypothetical protein